MEHSQGYETPIVLKEPILWRSLLFLPSLVLAVFGLLLAAGAILNGSGPWLEALFVGLVVACTGTLVALSSFRYRIVIDGDTVRLDDIRRGRPLSLEDLVACEQVSFGMRLRFQTSKGEREIMPFTRMESYETAVAALKRWCDPVLRKRQVERVT